MPFLVAVDSNPVRTIESMLLPNEILLWTGAPNRVFRFPRLRSQRPKGSFFLWLIAVVVFLFVFPDILGKGLKWMVLLVAGPAVVILVTMYIVDPLERANRYYAVTNQRAIIVSRSGGRLLHSVPFGAITTFELTQDFTGAGSIDCFVPGQPDFDIALNRGYNHVPGALFEYIADPSTVLALLKRQAPNAT